MRILITSLNHPYWTLGPLLGKQRFTSNCNSDTLFRLWNSDDTSTNKVSKGTHWLQRGSKWKWSTTRCSARRLRRDFPMPRYVCRNPESNPIAHKKGLSRQNSPKDMFGPRPFYRRQTFSTRTRSFSHFLAFVSRHAKIRN